MGAQERRPFDKLRVSGRALLLAVLGLVRLLTREASRFLPAQERRGAEEAA